MRSDGVPTMRSASVRPARFAAATPSPTYPPAHAGCRRSIESDRRSPIPRHPQHAAPAMGDGRVADHREQLTQRRLDAIVVVRSRLEVRIDSRAEAVSGTSPTEGDPIIRRALAVDHHPPVVAERLALAQPDLVPDARWQRLGRDHQRIQRDERPSMPGKIAGVGLGGADDDVSRDGAAVGDERWVGSARTERRGPDLGDRGALHDLAAEALDHGGQTVCRPGGIDAGARSKVQTAERVGGRKSTRSLCCVERDERSTARFSHLVMTL